MKANIFNGSRGGARRRLSIAAPNGAFTLLEVMIAVAVFFMAIFAILELTTRNLRLARSLQQIPVDAASLAALYSITNLVEEETDSGTFGDIHPSYRWTRDVFLVSTNGLYQVDFRITGEESGRRVDSTMSILLFRPDAAAGPQRRRIGR